MRTSLLFLSLAVILGFPGASPAQTPNKTEKMTSAPTRSFHIRYEAELKELPAGEQMQLWIPVPSNDAHQEIKNLSVTSPMPHTINTESVRNNRMVFIEGKIAAPELKVVIDYDVDRAIYTTDLAAFAQESNEQSAEAAQNLKPSKLCIVNDEIKKLAAKLTEGKKTTLEKARAFYDHVADDMKYDKPKDQPWGRGDTVYACSSKVGNCTDFHSYFISLCLAQNIPARFQIGLYGEYDKKPGSEYKTGGYHCWAEFLVPGKGWVPVDISEADKAGKTDQKYEFFFGGHTDNRVTLSMGRDLTLNPPQKGEPLNYFLNPYVEVGGKKFEGPVTKTSYWKDK